MLQGGAVAQKKTPPKAGGHTRMPLGVMAAPTHVTGMVKGRPMGSTFTVAPPRKPAVTVDASGAKFRYRGKFASAAILKPGATVTVTGITSGTGLKATIVNINSLPGQGGKGGKTGGAMMGGKKP